MPTVLTLPAKTAGGFGAVLCSNSLPCSDTRLCGEQAAPATRTPGVVTESPLSPGSVTATTRTPGTVTQTTLSPGVLTLTPN